MSQRKSWGFLVAAATLVLTACASSGAKPTISESSRDKVTSIEIANTEAATAYDLVNRLRPQWLRAGGTSSIGGGSIQNMVTLVYLDGHRIGTIETLRTITAAGISSMEWIPATRAAIVL
ncbi:MAG TPA: hypothetical protein VKO87_06860, partial [Gemmatimonadaceae bacterium]|nr:hypothetical protein [Gemmatimonadaceae bacterium]